MKSGAKLIRIARPVGNLKIILGKEYTYLSSKNGWIKIKERKQDGHAWDIKNFKAKL